MTDKQKLNSVLRLRLFFWTEEELSRFVQYELKGNHFNRFKAFRCEAYWSRLVEECRCQTGGALDLEQVIEAHEAASTFFQQHLKGRKLQRDASFWHQLLCCAYVGEVPETAVGTARRIGEAYVAKGWGADIHVALLLLLAHELLPTFKSKRWQDVHRPLADFRQAYVLLLEQTQLLREEATLQCRELFILKELRLQIEEEEKSGERGLNRLLLIAVTHDVLNRAFALLQPARLWGHVQEHVPMALTLPRLWRCEEEADNVVWEVEQWSEGGFRFLRHEIQRGRSSLKTHSCQVMFRDLGFEDLCLAVIMRPSFFYHNLLRRELPEDAIGFDYTEIERGADGATVEALHFVQDSPLAEKSMCLRALRDEHRIQYYKPVLDQHRKAADVVLQEADGKHAVWLKPVEVSVSQGAIWLKHEGALYRLEKWGENGEEQVAGISVLTHKDNFVMAHLVEGGEERRFLCLDSLNQNLDFDVLLRQPYFQKVEHLDELLSMF